MWPEVLYVGLAVIADAILFGAILPRLASAPITRENTAHPTHSTLSGWRFAAWVAINACLSCALFWGYIALREYRNDARLYLMCIVGSGVFFAFQGSAFRERLEDPDARFGGFVGLALGMVAAFVILTSRHP